jgi:hypothetical protein
MGEEFMNSSMTDAIFWAFPATKQEAVSVFWKAA